MVIAVTGGIGSGKSYICRRLSEEHGWPVYDTDAHARRLTLVSPRIRKGLTDILGSEVYTSDGQLNKPMLAAYLFASEENARRINALIHPVVKSDFEQWASEQQGTVLLETALLEESGMDSLADRIIRVDAPEEVRIERAMKRDGATREQILARMARQKPYPRPDEIMVNG